MCCVVYCIADPLRGGFSLFIFAPAIHLGSLVSGIMHLSSWQETSCSLVGDKIDQEPTHTYTHVSTIFLVPVCLRSDGNFYSCCLPHISTVVLLMGLLIGRCRCCVQPATFFGRYEPELPGEGIDFCVRYVVTGIHVVLTVNTTVFCKERLCGVCSVLFVVLVVLLN